MIKYLDFDSRFFGKKIYRLGLAEKSTIKDLKEDIIRLEDKGFDCAYIEVSDKEQKIMKFCLKKKFFLVQEKLTMIKKLNKTERIDNKTLVQTNLNNKHKKNLEKLAKELSKKSRFYSDPKFRKKAGHLYKKWLTESVYGGFAYKYFAFLDKSAIQGIITLRKKNNNLWIDLLIVNKKQQKKGIGTKLIHEVFSWMQKECYKNLYVNTQKNNATARLFYQSQGFKSLQKAYVFHIWKKQ